MKAALIIILLFCANGIYAQELDRRTITDRDSIRLGNYKVIERQIVQTNTPTETVQTIKSKPDTPIKNKQKAGDQDIPNDYINNPELDFLVTNYWQNQNSIKEAKNAGEIEQIESLEVESLTIRTSYIETFEGLAVESLNPEYGKLYDQFKKDQISNQD